MTIGLRKDMGHMERRRGDTANHVFFGAKPFIFAKQREGSKKNGWLQTL